MNLIARCRSSWPAIVWVCFVPISGALEAVGQEGPAERNITRVEPVLLQPFATAPPSENSGLFVGVNDFTRDPGIRPLRFAVHDAVELAYLFVVELKLIPARNCVLAISGKPSNSVVEQHRATLKQLGAREVAATKTDVLAECFMLSRAARRKSDLLVVSFSSHGFDEKRIAYVMPSDGFRALLDESGIKLNSVEEQMKNSAAGHRLLLVDACQERLGADTRSIGEKGRAMSPGFIDALKDPTGQAKLASCSVKEFSYEHSTLGGVGHGVFTFAVLEALRGGAVPEDDKLVKLKGVLAYVQTRVREWIDEQNRVRAADEPPKEQSPAFFGELEAFKMPFARRANDIATLLAAVKKRPTNEVYTAALRDQLVVALERLDVKKVSDRDLATTTQNFMDGSLSENVFVPYLERMIRPPAAVPPSPLELPFTADEAEAAQLAWSQYLRMPMESRNSIGVELRIIPPGKFTMGSSENFAQPNERPHPVRITAPFYAARHEVTVGQFAKFVEEKNYRTTRERLDGGEGRGWDRQRNRFGFGDSFTWRNPGWVQEDTHPVVNVSWNDAQAFVAWLSDKEGKKYRLMTEAEWEYCCRAGTKTLYTVGDNPNRLVEAGNVLDATAIEVFGNDPNFLQNVQNDRVMGDDKVSFTSPVGRFQANGFGLFDFHGNVCEWCQDRYADDYGSSSERDPTGAATGDERSARGGRFDTGKRLSKSFARNHGQPNMSDMILGFRVAMEIPK